MHNTTDSVDPTLCVAPMMAWTDRHCRYLHRLFSPSALLFTEMVTTGALLHGQQWHLLDHNPAEHPLALQLGGSDPSALAACAERAEAAGFVEVNLNVGCPSPRVQQGTFGACLMREPTLVAQCVRQMQAACTIPITVKCRLGVDDHDSDELLAAFIQEVADAGTQRFYVHARKAILGKLTPAQNRSIPPLQPERAAKLKTDFPHLKIILNGGIADTPTALRHLEWADGVMIGRAAYHNPQLLSELETAIYGADLKDQFNVVQDYRNYVLEELERGTKLHSMTRHLLNCFAGLPGARRYRRSLSDHRRVSSNDIAVFDEALSHIQLLAA